VTSAKNRLSLASLLADAPDDDNSGQVAAQGFQYQEWYDVLLVTELLEEANDFALGLEIKDDIAVLGSSTNPILAVEMIPEETEISAFRKVDLTEKRSLLNQKDFKEAAFLIDPLKEIKQAIAHSKTVKNSSKE